MDRNLVGCINRAVNIIVALRKESVDRNGYVKWKIVTTYVALRKESVDRNILLGTPDTWTEPSLSARRAWIEIPVTAYCEYLPMGRSPQGERG